MNSNQLKQFIAIAEEENVTRASQRLFMSQSALSNTLKLLEEELSCQLFDRKSNRLVLNSNGKKLFDYAKEINALIENVEHEFKATSKQKTEINIATSSHLYFPSFFKDSATMMSEYRLKVVEISYSDIFILLDRNNCDAVIAPDYPNVHKNLDRFENILLGEEHLWICFPPKHPFGNNNTISVSELSEEQFLSFENNIEFRWQDYLFMSKGINIEYHVELPRGYSQSNDVSGLDYPSFQASLVRSGNNNTNTGYSFVPISDLDATRNVYLWFKPESAELVNTSIKKYI